MDAQDYFFVGYLGDLGILNADLRNYSPEEFYALSFATRGCGIVASPADGEWVVDGKAIEVFLGDEELTASTPTSMRQFKRARSYFVGAERLDVLREFCLEATWEFGDNRFVLALIYSFEEESARIESTFSGNWEGTFRLYVGDAVAYAADVEGSEKFAVSAR